MHFHVNKCVTLHIGSIQALEVNGKKHLPSDMSLCEWPNKMEDFENLEIQIALKRFMLEQSCLIDYNLKLLIIISHTWSHNMN